MLKFTLLTAGFFVLGTLPGFAAVNPTAVFCSHALDAQGNLNLKWFQETRGTDEKFRISFTNTGGLLNGGVCWWHSEWTRNALYLAVMNPALPKPTTLEATLIMSDIMNSRKVTVIGGYPTLEKFTEEWEWLLQDVLDLRQLRTALDFGWIRGLTGGEHEDAKFLQGRMDELYRQVTVEHKIVFQMLQMPGIEAHSWLVTEMKPTTSGYYLTIIDSNSNWLVSHFSYVKGKDTEGKFDGVPFIAYTQQDEKFTLYQKRIKAFCTH